MSESSLRITAKAVRARSSVYSIFGIIVTGVLAALPAIFGGDAFRDLVFQWFVNNPVLGSFVLLSVQTLITEILKALRNGNVIKNLENEDMGVATAMREEGTIII